MEVLLLLLVIICICMIVFLCWIVSVNQSATMTNQTKIKEIFNYLNEIDKGE